jgi:polyribonucleotide nucleotidyltransferase
MEKKMEKEKMMSSVKSFKEEIAGKTLTIETGKLAQQANGSCTVRYGDTVVLATIVMSEKPRSDVDYFPLTVDYQEKLYAAGKIKTSRFIKREGKPSDEAILNSRMIDRSIRPLFPQHITSDIQVVCDVLSVDGENDSDVVAIIGASCAIAISDVPFFEILAACRVGRINGEWVLNPTFEAREKSDLDLTVSATDEGKVIMLEGKAKEIPEDTLFSAIEFGKKHIQKIISLIKQVRNEVGKEKKDVLTPQVDPKLKKEIFEESIDQIKKLLFLEKRKERKKEIARLRDSITEKLSQKYGEEKKVEIGNIFTKILEAEVRDNILKNEKRIGERKLNQIRPLEIEVGILPRTHGSGYFKRGETQVITLTTLGAPSSEQIIEDMEEEYKKRFIHHYNFPPYSVGEIKPLRGPSRRDIGHGALAEKALENLVPNKEKFPYTIRLVSEAIGSNGSSSMASVCASSLSLMDAGVPISSACAGIAMGLASDKTGKYKILTDIQDLEDIEGGMDFKIAGTRKGITAVQMDTKTSGLSDKMVTKTLIQAQKARFEILAAMDRVILKPRPDLSPYAPRIISFKINPEKIRDVIGPQGKVINEIIEQTGVEIDIEDDGTVNITSTDALASKKAEAWIREITHEVKVGERFTGKVTRVVGFGAFVAILPGIEGLIHISSLRSRGITDPEKEFSIGDIVSVKVIEIDSMGRINLALARK